MQRSEQWEESQPHVFVSPVGLAVLNAMISALTLLWLFDATVKRENHTSLGKKKSKKPGKDLRTCGASVLRSFLSDWQLDWQFADFH